MPYIFALSSVCSPFKIELIYLLEYILVLSFNCLFGQSLFNAYPFLIHHYLHCFWKYFSWNYLKCSFTVANSYNWKLKNCVFCDLCSHWNQFQYSLLCIVNVTSIYQLQTIFYSITYVCIISFCSNINSPLQKIKRL